MRQLTMANRRDGSKGDLAAQICDVRFSPDLKSGALVAVLSDFLPKQFSIDALYPHREHLPAKVRTFTDIVAKNFRQTDWDATRQETQ
jgi:DNA-binding transcriptional LysR family regulator